jgi:hypothetical protein
MNDHGGQDTAARLAQSTRRRGGEVSNPSNDDGEPLCPICWDPTRHEDAFYIGPFYIADFRPSQCVLVAARA